LKSPIVPDSTGLIALDRIGKPDLLPALFDPLIAPSAVVSEFGRRPEWLQERTPEDGSLVKVLRGDLGAGESEAIALADGSSYSILLDDRRARAFARRLGLRITGTLATLVRARQQGFVPSLAPLLDDLEQHGFFMSRELRAEALRLSGET
jgi:predicted nucleic acid-binding protein